MERNIDVIKDAAGNSIVMINDIRFKGKRSVNWDDVKRYLKKYVGDVYQIVDTEDIIYIGNELPDEYTGSVYTYSLRGMAAKAKANAAQGIPEMIGIATGKHFRENRGDFTWHKTHFSLTIILKEERSFVKWNLNPCLAYTDGSIQIARYPVFHYFQISIMFYFIIQGTFLLLCIEKKAETMIDGQNIMEDL